MVGRKGRKSRKPALMGSSHQRCWLWGRHVVRETLAAGRWPIVELRLANDLSTHERDTLQSLAAPQSIPLRMETRARLRQLCGASDHQGCLARMRPFPYQTIDALLADPLPPTALCLLDGIQDPHNFGAILRSADVLGIDGVIVGTTRQSDVNAIVARSSAGAVNHVPLAQTDDLPATARRLREEYGFAIVAADQHAEATPAAQDFSDRILVVIGNEGAGVSPELRGVCDRLVRIPQTGHVASLNAAVAAGILFYEIHRQREIPEQRDNC